MAEGGSSRAEPDYLQEASLSHLMRKATDSRIQATEIWIRDHVGRGHRYRPPPGGKLRKGLARVRKELAERIYQLLSGHAATAERLVRVGQIPSDRCRWCGSGERQTRYHLLARCRPWLPETRRLWRRIEVDCEWGAPRPPWCGPFSET